MSRGNFDDPFWRPEDDLILDLVVRYDTVSESTDYYYYYLLLPSVEKEFTANSVEDEDSERIWIDICHEL